MKLIRGLHNLTSQLPSSAITIGNFDGVHRGHQLVIQQLKQVAEKFSLPTVVIIFEPQPIEYFAPDRAPKRLSRFREKISFLRTQAIDYLVCLKFGHHLANQSAAEFVEQLLVNKLNARHIVVGDDFCFGKNRQGNFQYLSEQGPQHGFTVDRTQTLMHDGERISSTRLRQCITDSNFELARKLLGRHYSLSGRVAHGQKLGRQLGYPTINLKMGDNTMIVKGIFAVQVKGIDNQTLPGVASIGTRPTVNGVDTILEVYILNFERDVYGYSVEVEFLHKIRDEEKFDSLEDLTKQMHNDTQQAIAFFNRESTLV